MLPYEDSQPQLWSCPPKGRVPVTMSRELLPDSTHPLQGSRSPVPGRILRQRKCSCHRSGELPTLITLIAEAKVCNFHTLLGVKEEVPWLQVPVQDVPLEAELQGRDQLSEQPSGVSPVMSHGPPNGCTCPLTEALHLQEEGLLCVSYLQEFDSVFMVQSLHTIHFPEESWRLEDLCLYIYIYIYI